MYEEAVYLAVFGDLVLSLALAFVLILAVLTFFTIRKSKQYRQELADMYVASKIKQLAEKDKLDLTKEYESFKKWNKKQRLVFSSLDNAVEEELKEQLAEDIVKSA